VLVRPSEGPELVVDSGGSASYVGSTDRAVESVMPAQDPVVPRNRSWATIER